MPKFPASPNFTTHFTSNHDCKNYRRAKSKAKRNQNHHPHSMIIANCIWQCAHRPRKKIWAITPLQREVGGLAVRQKHCKAKNNHYLCSSNITGKLNSTRFYIYMQFTKNKGKEG